MKIKKLIVIGAILTMMFAAGCSGQQDSLPESESVQSEEQVYQYVDGLEPGEKRYFVTFAISQHHFTFDISEHIKDSLNTIEFPVMVDKDYFESVKIGDTVNEDFRWGSFIAKGSFGNWNIVVKDKKVITGDKNG